MQLVLSWPIRLAVLAILLFSLFVDGAGYVYRIANHLPLTGNVQGLPPNFGGWQLFFHRGLDLAGGTHIDYELTNFPAGQSRPDVQQRTIAVINKRVNALGVHEPESQLPPAAPRDLARPDPEGPRQLGRLLLRREGLITV